MRAIFPTRLTVALGLGLCLNAGMVTAATAPSAAQQRIAAERVSNAAISAHADAQMRVREALDDWRSASRAAAREATNRMVREAARANASLMRAQVREQRLAAFEPPMIDLDPPPLLELERRIGQAVRAERRIVGFGPMKVEQRIVDAVLQASARTGVDPVFKLALADKESSLRPGVSASTSSAQGLFQFIEQTWFRVIYSFGPQYGLHREASWITRGSDGVFRIEDAARRAELLDLRRDPLIAGLMAGEMLKRDGRRIADQLGRPLEAHEVYIVHFLGPGGAARFLALKDENPKANAAKEFAAAARANRTIFFRDGRRDRPRTIAEVDESFQGMMGYRLERYAAIGPARDPLTTGTAFAAAAPEAIPLQPMAPYLAARIARAKAAAAAAEPTAGYASLAGEGSDAAILPPARPADL